MMMFKIIFKLFGYKYEESEYYFLNEDLIVKTGYAYKHDKENEFKIDYPFRYFKPFLDRYGFLKIILYWNKNK